MRTMPALVAFPGHISDLVFLARCGSVVNDYELSRGWYFGLRMVRSSPVLFVSAFARRVCVVSVRCPLFRADRLTVRAQTMHTLRALWLSTLSAAPGAQAAMLWLNEVC